MNRYEQVGFVFAGDRGPLAVIDVVVAIANQDGPHPFFGIDARSQLPGDGERHVFLACPRLADSARIVATVSGIDGYHDIPSRRIGFGGAFNGL